MEPSFAVEILLYPRRRWRYVWPTREAWAYQGYSIDECPGQHGILTMFKRFHGGAEVACEPLERPLEKKQMIYRTYKGEALISEVYLKSKKNGRVCRLWQDGVLMLEKTLDAKGNCTSRKELVGGVLKYVVTPDAGGKLVRKEHEAPPPPPPPPLPRVVKSFPDAGLRELIYDHVDGFARIVLDPTGKQVCYFLSINKRPVVFSGGKARPGVYVCKGYDGPVTWIFTGSELIYREGSTWDLRSPALLARAVA